MSNNSLRSRVTASEGHKEDAPHNDIAEAKSAAVPMPPASSLRPTWLQALVHTATYLFRNAVLCSLAAIFVFQPVYMKIIHTSLVQGLSPVAACVLIFALLCHALPWLVFNGLFAFMDSLLPETGRSSLLRLSPFRSLGAYFAQYKLPRRPAQQPSAKLVRKTVIVEMVSNLFVFPLATYLALCKKEPETFPLREAYIPGFAPHDWEAASPRAMLAAFLNLVPHFMIANAFNEIGFYVAHATLHSHPWLYKTFHKQHHEFIGTISVAAEYAGLLESLVANLFPTAGYFTYMLLFRTNSEPSAFVQVARAWPVFVTWFWERLLETYETHSGFCFSKSLLGRVGLLHGARARFHDFHHTHNVSNYGSFVFADMFLNTMDPYLRHDYLIEHKRAKREAAAA